jgi:RNA recognition motif-containing protein
MPKRIRVEGLSMSTTPATVQAGFTNFGPLVRCQLEFDVNGVPLGVAHLEYGATEAGAAAIANMNNTPFDGATISVREDK